MSAQIIKSVQGGVAIDLSAHMSGTTIGLNVCNGGAVISLSAYMVTQSGLRAHMDGATIDLRAFMSNVAIG